MRSVSHIVSLRNFSRGAVSRSVSLRDLFAKRSYDFCRCETFRAERLMLCVIARFICVASHTLCCCEIYLRSGLTICVVVKLIATCKIQAVKT